MQGNQTRQGNYNNQDNQGSQGHQGKQGNDGDPHARSITGLTRQQIAQLLASDIPDGSIVNLGIGMPTLVGDYLPPDKDILLHSENGILGMGPAASGRTWTRTSSTPAASPSPCWTARPSPSTPCRLQ